MGRVVPSEELKVRCIERKKKKRTDFELAVLLDQIQWSKIEWEKSQLILMERRKQNLGVSGCRCTVKLLGVKER